METCQSIRSQPRALLEMIPGLELVPLEESEICCGSAGIYNLVHNDMAEKLLQPGTEVPAEFFEGEPINVVLPEIVEARVVTTAPPARSQQDSARKEASLNNGLTVQVPLFVAPGELVSVDLRTGRYVERVRSLHKKAV